MHNNQMSGKELLSYILDLTRFTKENYMCSREESSRMANEGGSEAVDTRILLDTLVSSLRGMRQSIS